MCVRKTKYRRRVKIIFVLSMPVRELTKTANFYKNAFKKCTNQFRYQLCMFAHVPANGKGFEWRNENST